MECHQGQQFCRVLAIVGTKHVENLISDLYGKILSPETPQVVALDGKTHRGCKSADKMNLHMVSAYAVKDGLILASKCDRDKPNEYTNILNIIEILNLAGHGLMPLDVTRKSQTP